MTDKFPPHWKNMTINEIIDEIREELLAMPPIMVEHDHPIFEVFKKWDIKIEDQKDSEE